MSEEHDAFKSLRLDISKLENVQRDHLGKIVARCPVCALEGKDKKGNHLGILPDGRWNCAVNNGHNLVISKMVKGEEIGSWQVYIPPQPKIEMPEEWPVSILDGLVKDYSYWIKRGIPAEICKEYNIGVATRAQMYGRSVIPIFNLDKSKIIGFTGRKINEDMNGPKWKHLGNKKDWLFSGHSIMPKYMRRVILVESPVCTMRLRMEDIRDTQCLFGVKITSKVMGYLLQSNPDEILISTNNEIDNDSIGNKAAIKIQEQLYNFFLADKVKIALPLAKDFDEHTKDQMKEWRSKWNI